MGLMSGSEPRRGGRNRKIFNIRIDKLEKKSANERLLRSPQNTDSNNNENDDVMEVDNESAAAAAPQKKRPFILEACVPPPESRLTMRLKKARMGDSAMFKKIICRICGLIVVGRVRRLCPVHPNHIWLLDVSACPKCEVNPMYLIEHDFQDGEAMPVNKLIQE